MNKPKIGINCMIHNPCQTCYERPARYIIRNKYTKNRLRICEKCKKEIIDNR